MSANMSPPSPPAGAEPMSANISPPAELATMSPKGSSPAGFSGFTGFTGFTGFVGKLGFSPGFTGLGGNEGFSNKSPSGFAGFGGGIRLACSSCSFSFRILSSSRRVNSSSLWVRITCNMSSI